MKANNMDKIDSPLYLISLNTTVPTDLDTEVNVDQEEDGNNNNSGSGSGNTKNSSSTDQILSSLSKRREKVEFACTLEQLQDLVTRLKDATKQMERSAANI